MPNRKRLDGMVRAELRDGVAATSEGEVFQAGFMGEDQEDRNIFASYVASDSDTPPVNETIYDKYAHVEYAIPEGVEERDPFFLVLMRGNDFDVSREGAEWVPRQLGKDEAYRTVPGDVRKAAIAIQWQSFDNDGGYTAAAALETVNLMLQGLERDVATEVLDRLGEGNFRAAHEARQAYLRSLPNTQ